MGHQPGLGGKEMVEVTLTFIHPKAIVGCSNSDTRGVLCMDSWCSMYVGGLARIFELGACLAEKLFIVFDKNRTDITHLSPYHVRLLVRSQYSHQKPKGIFLWQPAVGQCPGAGVIMV